METKKNALEQTRPPQVKPGTRVPPADIITGSTVSEHADKERLKSVLISNGGGKIGIYRTSA